MSAQSVKTELTRTHLADAGYCAPYLYLLEEEKLSQEQSALTPHTMRKLSQVHRALREGCGQGRGDSYRPWIRIRRNFSSPTSHQIFDSVGINRRNHHFLSRLEFETALQVAYLGPVELRECLPAWPIEHPHPDSGLDEYVDARRDLVPGLIDLARQAGIDHGCFVGTTVPYVGSVDLVFRIARGPNWGLVGISCKPKSIADASERAAERIELDRLYCQAAGAHHVHEDGTAMNQLLVKQLRAIRPLMSELDTHRTTQRLSDFVGNFEGYSTERSILESTLAAGRRTKLSEEDAFLFFRLGAWLRKIDIDLSAPLLMKSQIQRGATGTASSLAKRYFGVSGE
ncbi:hypothetical protein [Acidovorax sp. Q11]